MRSFHLLFVFWKHTQEVAVEKVVEFMDAYSLSQVDFDTVVELSKFKVCPGHIKFRKEIFTY